MCYSWTDVLATTPAAYSQLTLHSEDAKIKALVLSYVLVHHRVNAEDFLPVIRTEETFLSFILFCQLLFLRLTDNGCEKFQPIKMFFPT